MPASEPWFYSSYFFSSDSGNRNSSTSQAQASDNKSKCPRVVVTQLMYHTSCIMHHARLPLPTSTGLHSQCYGYPPAYCCSNIQSATSFTFEPHIAIILHIAGNHMNVGLDFYGALVPQLNWSQPNLISCRAEETMTLPSSMSSASRCLSFGYTYQSPERIWPFLMRELILFISAIAADVRPIASIFRS